MNGHRMATSRPNFDLSRYLWGAKIIDGEKFRDWTWRQTESTHLQDEGRRSIERKLQLEPTLIASTCNIREDFPLSQKPEPESISYCTMSADEGKLVEGEENNPKNLDNNKLQIHGSVSAGDRTSESGSARLCFEECFLSEDDELFGEEDDASQGFPFGQDKGQDSPKPFAGDIMCGGNKRESEKDSQAILRRPVSMFTTKAFDESSRKGSVDIRDLENPVCLNRIAPELRLSCGKSALEPLNEDSMYSPASESSGVVLLETTSDLSGLVAQHIMLGTAMRGVYDLFSQWGAKVKTCPQSSSSSQSCSQSFSQEPSREYCDRDGQRKEK